MGIGSQCKGEKANRTGRDNLPHDGEPFKDD